MTNKVFFYIKVLLVFFLVSLLACSSMGGHCESVNVWYVHDVINPSLDQVNWYEEGVLAEAPSWIADGSWSQASMSQSLVGPNDIFVSTYEEFNWLQVQPVAESWYGLSFDSFSDFQNCVINNPSPWLNYSWDVDTYWYGVSLNTTRVMVSFNDTTSTVDMWMWFHITRIPEYLIGQGTLENWLTGFDLTPVSIGSLTLWELYQDYNADGQTYNLRFEAPADILSQLGNTYNCTIPVSPSYQDSSYLIQQRIDINMPPDTEVQTASPSSMSNHTENEETFLIESGDSYPSSFTVVSGPTTKSLGQTALDDASVWLLAPSGWAAIGSLLVLSFTGLRGRKIWRRNKLYHHIYKSMVTVYDMYSKDLAKFHQEIEDISSYSIKMLLDDRITDEQFEKLLKRRDDLMDRSKKQSTPPPPET